MNLQITEQIKKIKKQEFMPKYKEEKDSLSNVMQRENNGFPHFIILNS